MQQPKVLVFHDETGSTHPGSPFAHCAAVLRADRRDQLLAELELVRRTARVADSHCFYWNRVQDSSRGRSSRRLATAFLDWYESRGYELLGFNTWIFDRSSRFWSDAWVQAERDFDVYNRTAASTIAHSLSYLVSHTDVAERGILPVQVFSDYRKRVGADKFHLELHPLVLRRCSKFAVQFVTPVQLIGAYSPANDPEIRMAKEVLQFVDFVAGASMATWSSNPPANRFKRECVERVSEWHSCTRSYIPNGQFGHLKRSFEIKAMPIDECGRADRFFALHHRSSQSLAKPVSPDSAVPVIPQFQAVVTP